MEQDSSTVLLKKISFRAFECSNKIPMELLRDKPIFCEMDRMSITLNTVIGWIHQAFELKNKKIQMFDYQGMELTEDSDLWKLMDHNESRKIIFFTKQSEIFENKNILRLFKFVKKLGEGGFGKVYLAEHKFSNELFAIKFLRHSFKTINDVRFLYKEIDVLARLDHRNIIKLHMHCSTEENKIALILEYASGGTLKEKGMIDETEARGLLEQILNTVGYCHNKEIIHRDLKPDNILFSNKYKTTIKVIDFGICGLFRDKSKAGSLQYLPPEVVAGRNVESLPQVDIWAIGCILFEMLTGKKAFDGTGEEIKNKIIAGFSTVPSHISIEAAHLIGSLLKYSTSERITIEDALNHPWIKEQKLKDEKEICRAKKYFEDKKRQLSISVDNKILLSGKNHRNNQTHSPGSLLRGPTRSKTGSKKEKTNELPSLMTKIPGNFNENMIFQYNYTLMKKYHGHIPNFLQPIGLNKDLKHKFTRIKEFMKNYYGDCESPKVKKPKTMNNNTSQIEENDSKTGKEGLKEIKTPILTNPPLEKKQQSIFKTLIKEDGKDLDKAGNLTARNRIDDNQLEKSIHRKTDGLKDMRASNNLKTVSVHLAEKNKKKINVRNVKSKSNMNMMTIDENLKEETNDIRRKKKFLTTKGNGKIL